MSAGQSPFPRGVFTLSIDTEFGWGGFDAPDPAPRWRLEERSREVVRRLLELFARYEVSATWVLVGHLFLESCRPVDGTPHPEIVRPRPAWYPRDWFACDPGTDWQRDPLWYAPDVVRWLQEAKPRQEIGSHSFSHLIFGDSGCSPEAADTDLAACVEAARPWGIALRSFVYPRNRVGHLDALARHGFRCYRGPDPAWYEGFPRPARRLAHYLDDFLALPPPTVLPRREGALWNLPGSTLFQGMDGIRGWIPAACRTRRGLAGLRRAAARREVFHLWFHPVNFSGALDPMLRAFEPILAEAARLRDRGQLDILPMDAVIDDAENFHSTRTRPDISGHPSPP